MPERLGLATRCSAGLFVAALCPARRSHWVLGWTRTALLIALIVAGLGWAWSWRHRPAVVRSAITATATIGALALGGAQLGAWTGAAMVLGAWCVGGTPPLARWLPEMRWETSLAVAGVSLPFASRAPDHFSWTLPVLFLISGIAIACVADRLSWLPGVIGEAAATAISRVLFGALGLVVIGVPASARALVRADRSGRRGQMRAGWVELPATTHDPRRLWVVPSRRRSPGTAARRTVVLLVAVALAGGGSWYAYQRSTRPRRTAYDLSRPQGTVVFADDSPAAMDDSPWWPEYRSNIEFGQRWLFAFRDIGVMKVPDGRSKYINVEQGYRVTWHPPACNCRRLTVWLYGGSTAFGLGQRDDHTIASELARRAWADGIALDVENRGMPQDVHWQEGTRFAWDLTRTVAPDVVIFYDGTNELLTAVWLADNGYGDTDVQVEPQIEDFIHKPDIEEVLARRNHGDATHPPPAPEGMSPAPHRESLQLTPEQLGELATTRYGTTRAMTVDLAASHGSQGFWFWQPSRVSRPPVEGEPSTPHDAASRAMSDAAQRSLPAGVIDLSDSFDAVPDPLFIDDSHHNEAGAAVVAAAMYGHVRPTIDALVGAGVGPGDG